MIFQDHKAQGSLSTPRKRAIAAVTLAMIFLVIAFAFCPWVQTTLLPWVMTLTATLGIWAFPVIVSLMVAHNFIPVPAEMIALAAGAILGVTVGAIAVWLGAMLGAILAFAISRYWGRDVVNRLLPDRHLKRLDVFKGRNSWMILLSARLIPLISFNLVNYAAGLTPVSWRVFLWTTAIGIVPIIVLMTLAGAQVVTISAETIL